MDIHTAYVIVKIKINNAKIICFILILFLAIILFFWCLGWSWLSIESSRPQPNLLILIIKALLMLPLDSFLFFRIWNHAKIFEQHWTASINSYFWLDVTISCSMHKPSKCFHFIFVKIFTLEVFTSKIVLGLDNSWLRSQFQIKQMQFYIFFAQISKSSQSLHKWQFEIAKWISKCCPKIKKLNILIFFNIAIFESTIDFSKIIESTKITIC